MPGHTKESANPARPENQQTIFTFAPIAANAGSQRIKSNIIITATIALGSLKRLEEFMVTELIEGHIYIVRHAGQLVEVRLNSIKVYYPNFNFNSLRPGRSYTRYHCTKLSTGREVIFKSKVKFLRDVALGSIHGF